MTSNIGNVCVICQDDIQNAANPNESIPLPCIKQYVHMKRLARANIECPVCRQVSFLYGSTTFTEFCRTLDIDVVSSDIKTIATTMHTPMAASPHVVIHIPEIRPFQVSSETHVEIPQKYRVSCCFVCGLLLMIAMLIVTLCVVVKFA
jgi:hypothetical protein